MAAAGIWESIARPAPCSGLIGHPVSGPQRFYHSEQGGRGGSADYWHIAYDDSQNAKISACSYDPAADFWTVVASNSKPVVKALEVIVNCRSGMAFAASDKRY